MKNLELPSQSRFPSEKFLSWYYHRKIRIAIKHTYVLMRNDLEEVTISNINGLYGATATADDAINMAVQVQIELFTVVQQ